jgi:dihydrofolate reductase
MSTTLSPLGIVHKFGTLFRTMLDARLDDRIEVSIVPIVLGAGVKLVPDGVRHRLRFVSSRAFQSGIQQLIYDVVQ